MKVASVTQKSICNSSNIMKPNYHLNYGKKRIERALKNKKPFIPLGDAVNDVFTGGIFKRIFVENPDFGLPYISAQHMMNSNPLDVAKIISKKYTPRQVDMTLRTSQILVSCAGTVGNVRLIGADLEGVIGSQDIIRIISDQTTLPYGYIYAYLASPTAFNYIQSYIYGSVVPRIDPKTLAKLPVPLLAEDKQNEIHNLIVKSSELRVEANRLLREAQEIFIVKVKNIKKHKNITEINISRIKSDLRFGGNFFLSIGDLFESKIKESEFKYLNEYVSTIFTSGRDKRNYTKSENGVPFLSNGDISSFNPFSSCNYIVKKNVKDHSLIKEDMILTGRVGQDTVGKIYLPYQKIIGTVASDNIIRIKVYNKQDINLLFAFLSSEIGNEIIRKRKSGVGQPFVTEDMFNNIPIPSLNDTEKLKIDKNIEVYRDNINTALLYELRAINLIEKEIESWQE